MIMPLVSWAFGLTETFSFTVAFISASCMFGFCLVTAFLAYHTINMYNGQTTYERSHKLKEYDLGWKENMRQIYGVNWCYAWISSFFSSPLPANGVEFIKKSMYENVKDL